MVLEDNEAYQQIKQRMTRIDLRSPYYALASADLNLMDNLLVGAHVTISMKTARVDELTSQLEAVQVANQLLTTENAALQEEIIQLQEQLNGGPILQGGAGGPVAG